MYDLPDPAFLGAAYLRLLGRAADPHGFKQYLAQLQTGKISRAQLVGLLQASEEGQAARGLPAAQAERHAALWPDTPPVARSRVARNAAQVLALRGEQFVECAYAWAAGRRPSESELMQARPTEDPGLRKRWLAKLASEHRWPWQRRALAFTPPGGTDSARLRTKSPGEHRSAAHAAASSARTGLFTIASRSYRPFVDALMNSVRLHHPEFQLYVLLVDEPQAGDPPAPHGCEVITADAIGVPCFDDMTLRYDVMELSTALKPWFMRWLFDQTDLQQLIYLDPDIRLYAPLNPVLGLLEAGHEAVLTPHLTQPLDDRGLPDDRSILQSGVFNLGFAAFSRSDGAKAFIDWWCDKVRTGALVDFANNLFTDQRWCDMAPAFLPGLAVLHHPGCNVAYWNLPQRSLEQQADGHWTVNGEELCFFHFSGLNPTERGQLSKHQTRFAAGEPAALQPLLDAYRSELMQRGWPHWREQRCAYDAVEGVPVPALARALYRRLNPRPADTSREQALTHLLRQSWGFVPGDLAPPAAVPELMLLVHSMRADLSHAFDLTTPAGRAGCWNWLLAAGAPEYRMIDFMRAARGLHEQGQLAP